jgi:hypothetical protein
MADIGYTYRIGWSWLDKHYYGSRYGKGCNPSDLWVTYFTSSKHVSEFRKLNGEPDIVEVRKTFIDPKQSLDWEQKVLKRLKVKLNERWLNVAIGKPTFQGKKHSEETLQKMRKPKPDGFAETVSANHKGRKHSEKHRANNSAAKKGKTSRAKIWIFICNGEQVTITNLKRYCRDQNLNVSCMTDVYKGKQKQHQGFRRVTS